jgi:flagellar biosynthesis protein FlhA
MWAALRKNIAAQSDLALVLGVVGILMVLITPIPPFLLDLLLILNISIALLILLLTFYVEKPLQFSTFPSILLIATLFRLSLNVAATRLILSDGEAGKVIEAIGNHVIAGNYVVGLIIFLILIVVQYVVVTNGAQRVAEVAARFTLDSMPGKQMSIDADMNIGLIDETEAKQRRKEIEKEANFYGAMDGASKFVKGDAIAGIIIVLINIIGGLTIGIAQRGLSWVDALHTYTLLTVGDGIVTQIPALIISTGTGIIVTRAASDGFLSGEISKQVLAYPKILLLIVGGLFGAMLLPGIPAWTVLVVATLAAGLAYYAYRHGKRPADTATDDATTADENLYDSLNVDPMLIEVGAALVPMVGESAGLMDRVGNFRKQFAQETGFIVPKVKITDNNKLGGNDYQIVIYGTKVANGELHIDKTLAINPGNEKPLSGGLATKEPTYGLPAVWIDEALQAEARQNRYTLVDPQTVLITHLGQIFRKHSAELLTRQETGILVDHVRKHNQALIEELIPGIVTLSEVQKVLQNLLREDVSIRNLEVILEVLVDQARISKDPNQLTEAVRQRLASQICQTFANSSGDLYVLVLDPAVERTISNALQLDPAAKRLPALEPRFAEQVLKRLAGNVEKMMASNLTPVLLCGAELRIFLKDFIQRSLPHLKVISMNEVATNVKLKSFGVVTV